MRPTHPSFGILIHLGICRAIKPPGKLDQDNPHAVGGNYPEKTPTGALCRATITLEELQQISIAAPLIRRRASGGSSASTTRLGSSTPGMNATINPSFTGPRRNSFRANACATRTNSTIPTYPATFG